MSFLTREQINKIGFASVGKNIYISDKASIYNPSKISMGDNIRIDDFCILSAGSGGIELGDIVHIACHATLIGDAKIKVGTLCGISSKVAIYSTNDDYSGHSLPGCKHIQEQHRNLTNKPVIIEDYTLIGALTVVLPGVTISEGAVVGSLSFVRKSLKSWSIYTGNPLRFIKQRSQDMLRFMPEIRQELEDGRIQDDNFLINQ